MTGSARRMGGAKRYPSVAVGEDDGFREGLNPSYRTTQTRLRVRRAPGIPHALNGAKVKCTARARIAPRGREVVSAVIARSEATKQSILSLRGEMDCFAEPVIG